MCICQGEWLQCAKQILCNNGIEQSIFADAVITLLAMGRRKGCNIYITGPVNCGKTFILDPLQVIYNTVLSPATCSYAWLGVEDKEVIFLNDFRYTPAILPWNDRLLLLEGHTVHFAAHKTTYARDIEFTSDTPVFATSKSPIVFIIGSSIDERDRNDGCQMEKVSLFPSDSHFLSKDSDTMRHLFCTPYTRRGLGH